MFWKTWNNNGIATINDLFEEAVLNSFQGLKEKYNVNDKGDFGDIFSYAVVYYLWVIIQDKLKVSCRVS